MHCYEYRIPIVGIYELLVCEDSAISVEPLITINCKLLPWKAPPIAEAARITSLPETTKAAATWNPNDCCQITTEIYCSPLHPLLFKTPNISKYKCCPQSTCSNHGPCRIQNLYSLESPQNCQNTVENGLFSDDVLRKVPDSRESAWQHQNKSGKSVQETFRNTKENHVKEPSKLKFCQKLTGSIFSVCASSSEPMSFPRKCAFLISRKQKKRSVWIETTEPLQIKCTNLVVSTTSQDRTGMANGWWFG